MITMSGENPMRAARGSMHTAKICGDNGYPWLVLLDISKGEERKPEVRTLADGKYIKKKFCGKCHL